MLERIQAHLPEWKESVTLADVVFTRMSGTINPCFKVEVKRKTAEGLQQAPCIVLYRKFLNDLIDKEKEAMVFNLM